jgi:hypothetical protein
MHNTKLLGEIVVIAGHVTDELATVFVSVAFARPGTTSWRTPRKINIRPTKWSPGSAILADPSLSLAAKRQNTISLLPVASATSTTGDPVM